MLLRAFRRGIRRGPGGVVLCLAIIVAPLAAHSAPVPADSTRPAPPVEVKLPADISFDRSVKPDSAVTFSHATHVGFAGNTCTSCHPKPFHMLHPTHHTSHADMNAGGSCGTCHDGKRAFGVRDHGSCGTCHAGRASRQVAVKDPPGLRITTSVPRKLPAARRFAKGESSPGQVTFRHETHLKRGEACVTCHPNPFPMRFTPPAPSGGMHEKTACGVCHDAKKAFGTEDPAACNRCHIDTGAKP